MIWHIWPLTYTMKNESILLWKPRLIQWFDLADVLVSFIFWLRLFLWSVPLCFPVMSVSVYLTEPFGPIEHALWQHGRQKIFSPRTIKFHCPFTHQGIEVEIVLKWTISLVRAPYPPGKAENISLWGKGNWGGGRWFRTFLFCLYSHAVLPWGVKSHHWLTPLTSAISCLSLFFSVPPFCFPICLSVPG